MFWPQSVPVSVSILILAAHQIFYIPPVWGLTSIFPVVDLNSIRAVCEDYGHGDYFDRQIDAVHVCLRMIPEQLSSTGVVDAPESPVIECKYSSAYLRCYAFATELLNTGDEGSGHGPGRGDVLRRIHEAVHAQMCADGGEMLKSALFDSVVPSGDGDGASCSPAYNTTAECVSEEAYDAWESMDICTSFNALLSCQEAALLQPQSHLPSHSSSNCGDLPLTQLILQRLRAAQRELGCVPRLNETVMDGGGSVAWLFPNPHQELLRLKSYCKTQRGIRDIQGSLNAAHRCLDQERETAASAGLGAGSPSSTSQSGDQCQLIEARDRCWSPIATKLDECIRGRGTTVTRIYTEMVRVTCLKREELKALPVSEKCVVNTEVPACKASDDADATGEGVGENLCKVFQAKQACLTEAIADCKHDGHKSVVEDTLEQVRTNLGCSTSKEEAPKSSSSGRSTFPIVIVLMLAIFAYAVGEGFKCK